MNRQQQLEEIAQDIMNDVLPWDQWDDTLSEMEAYERCLHPGCDYEIFMNRGGELASRCSGLCEREIEWQE